MSNQDQIHSLNHSCLHLCQDQHYILRLQAQMRKEVCPSEAYRPKREKGRYLKIKYFKCFKNTKLRCNMIDSSAHSLYLFN